MAAQQSLPGAACNTASTAPACVDRMRTSDTRCMSQVQDNQNHTCRLASTNTCKAEAGEVSSPVAKQGQFPCTADSSGSYRFFTRCRPRLPQAGHLAQTDLVRPACLG